MNSKNEVFEYLIDQLRQQLPVVDVMGEIKRWSIDRSIVGRGIYTDEENAVIDAYIGLEHNLYKQQCEDLAHEVRSLKNQLARYKKPYIAYVKKTDWVQGDSRFLKKWGKHRADILRECIQEQDAEIQSLKNQLRDASAQIKELTCALDCAENEVMCLRSVVDLDPKGAIGYIRRANSAMTDTMRHQYLSKALEELGCKDAPEQSGCCEEDTQECEHEWQFYGVGFPCMCRKCGLKK